MVVVIALSLHFGGNKANEAKDNPESQDQGDVGPTLLCSVTSDLWARHEFRDTQGYANQTAEKKA
jgi:hypothetical protein